VWPFTDSENRKHCVAERNSGGHLRVEQVKDFGRQCDRRIRAGNGKMFQSRQKKEDDHALRASLGYRCSDLGPHRPAFVGHDLISHGARLKRKAGHF
jgi:hypothetical protein